MTGLGGSDTMGLVQMCDDVLQYVCAINRDRRRQHRSALNAEAVRDDIKAIFNRLDADLAQASATMRNQWDNPEVGGHVRRMLHYFVDDVIEHSHLEFRHHWEPISYHDYGEGYQQDFWRVVDEDLQRPHDRQVHERLTLYYVLIGLGFQGQRRDQGPDGPAVAERLRGEMDRICEQVPSLKRDRDAQTLKQFLATTEQPLQVRGNHPPRLPSRDIWLICLVVLGFGVLLVVVANWWLYSQGIEELTQTLATLR